MPEDPYVTKDPYDLALQTNTRFWKRTKYKPGSKLNMSIAKDREMAKVWLRLFHELQNHRGRARTYARRVVDETITPYVLTIEKHDGSMEHQEFERRSNLEVQYMWLLGQPDMYKYAAAFDFTQRENPVIGEQFSNDAQPLVASWYGSIGADARATSEPATRGKWVVRGLGAAAVIGVGLMARNAYQSMKKADADFRSAGRKGPFGT